MTIAVTFGWTTPYAKFLIYPLFPISRSSCWSTKTLTLVKPQDPRPRKRQRLEGFVNAFAAPGDLEGKARDHNGVSSDKRRISSTNGIMMHAADGFGKVPLSITPKPTSTGSSTSNPAISRFNHADPIVTPTKRVFGVPIPSTSEMRVHKPPDINTLKSIGESENSATPLEAKQKFHNILLPPAPYSHDRRSKNKAYSTSVLRAPSSPFGDNDGPISKPRSVTKNVLYPPMLPFAPHLPASDATGRMRAISDTVFMKPLVENPEPGMRTISTTRIARATDLSTESGNSEVASIFLMDQRAQGQLDGRQPLSQPSTFTGHISERDRAELLRGLRQSPERCLSRSPYLSGGLADRASALFSRERSAIALWQREMEVNTKRNLRSANPDLRLRIMTILQMPRRGLDFGLALCGVLESSSSFSGARGILPLAQRPKSFPMLDPETSATFAEQDKDGTGLTQRDLQPQLAFCW
ncbi:hypothetical protein FISHEDRAFT_56333 [Fistulina hepatica ATCC 64428]|uniref:Uncharacterized protein n=1 Tax=Fistulina hepatica ATCC 64428 TaxID=1128425 RepID=A0A0D7AKM4_9AGAR|nr:hypothetical protein FISHEDRAFT_56333 [Fistulina hepatica ATCC 64428]